MAVISSAINLESYHDDDDGTVKDGNNKIKINIQFCLNLGEDGNCEGQTPEDDGAEPDGIDVTIDGEDLIEDGEVVDDCPDEHEEEEPEEMEPEEEEPEEEEPEEEMPDECEGICGEYAMCLQTAHESLENAENTLMNDVTVETLFNEQPNIFNTVEEFKNDLFEDMLWDIEEGKTSFTPLTLDDIPSCDIQTEVPESCVDLVDSKASHIDSIRQDEVDQRNFQMYLMAFPCDQVAGLFEQTISYARNQLPNLQKEKLHYLEDLQALEGNTEDFATYAATLMY